MSKILYQSYVHPEARLQEILISNISRSDFENLSFKTKRLGATAYDGNGVALKEQDWYPVFIDSDELKSTGIELHQLQRMLRNHALVLSR